MLHLFGKRRWSLDLLPQPWGELKSIYAYLRAGGADPLPDEQMIFPPNQIRWVGGAMDGVLGFQSEGGEKSKRVFRIVGATQRLQQEADGRWLKNLYETIIEDAIVGCIDVVLKELNKSHSNTDRLSEIGRYLAACGGHREAVKFGVALIGVFGTNQDSDILKTLGKHDEFTAFAAVALARVSENPERDLWEMAKLVHGWGRVQIVQRLKDTGDPEIQFWMLREGFRNEIMNEYLACICARAGRLHERLSQHPVDLSLLDAVADIIRALISGGPAEDIDDYEFAVDACERYVNIVWSRNDLGLRHFLAVAAVSKFLEQAGGWEKRMGSGWTELRRETMQALAKDVLARERWRDLVRIGLAVNDGQGFYDANQAAEQLSIDTWAVHLARVKSSPLTSYSWYHLMRQTDDARIGPVLAFAEFVMPFTEIETGPSDSLGSGPEFQAHQALDWVLQGLRRFPGRGWRIIKAGLRSPVIRNRNGAIQTLAAWSRGSWTEEMQNAVERAQDEEPQQDIKARLESLLSGSEIT